MNLHEYQGKQLFAEYGLPVSKGFACESAQEALAAADQIEGTCGLSRHRSTQAAEERLAGKLVKTKDEIRVCRAMAGQESGDLPDR